MKPFLESVDPKHQAFAARHFVHLGDGFPFQWHYHPEIELTLILESQGNRFVGDSVEPFEEGEIILIGPNVPHSWHSTSLPSNSGESVVFQFLPDCLGESFFVMSEMSAIRDMLDESKYGLRFHGDEALRVIADRMKVVCELDEAQRIIQFLQILEQLTCLERTRLCSHSGFYSYLEKQQQRIEKAAAYIHEHYLGEMKQEDVASEVFMSTASFSRFFKKSMGVSFQDYVNQLRINHACQLLRTQDVSISDVCYDSGYRNLSNFNRRFKQVTGMSPRQYRASV